MPKRKRDEPASLKSPSSNVESSNRALRIRNSRLIAQIDQSTILLHRALKVARGFERQKLGRRQKNARGDVGELARLKEEIKVLKGLDLGGVARLGLGRRLGRVKRVSEVVGGMGGEVLGGVGEEGRVKGVGGAGAEANVVARLMNSNPVKEVMPGIMERVLGCLGVEEGSSTRHGRGEANGASLTKKLEARNLGCDEDENVTASGQEGLAEDGDEVFSDESTYESGDESMADSDRFIAEGSDSEDQDTDKLIANARRRLASSSPSEAGSDAEEDYDDGSESGALVANRKSQPQEAMLFSASASSSPSRSATTPRLRPTNTISRTSQTLPPHTTFLPSLTLGGYFSGSDSDSNSSSVQNPNLTNLRHPRSSGRPGPALPRPRKNRRGQRARQEIAEKKYGGAAKHLRRQRVEGKEDGGGRDAGWDGRKGATTESSSATRKVKGNRRFAGKGKWEPTGANGEAVITKSAGREKKTNMNRSSSGKGVDSEGPIHPSWEAARKRKLQSQKVMGAFQGKKITF